MTTKTKGKVSSFKVHHPQVAIALKKARKEGIADDLKWLFAVLCNRVIAKELDLDISEYDMHEGMLLTTIEHNPEITNPAKKRVQLMFPLRLYDRRFIYILLNSYLKS